MTNAKFMRAGAALLLAMATGVSACSSSPETPSFGEHVAAQSGEVARIGENWTEGEELILKGQELVEDGRDAVDDGERLVRKGEKKMSAGRSDISKGERMIAKGERMKREAEQAYRMRGGAFPQT